MEGWTLDGLDLNDGTDYILQSVEFLPARKRIQWAENPDSDGSLPVGETQYDNAEWIGQVRIVPQATRALALTKRAALTDKLQNCAGQDFVWTNSGGTELTWYCLTAEYDEVPYNSSGDGIGYHLNFPIMTVRIVCRPFGYGAEVVGSDTTYATPLGSLALTAVTGDVDAEATLIVTDNATQARKHIEVGLEHTHYVAASPFDLFLDEGDLSVTGTQAAAVADGDAYTPGNAFELKPLFAGWQDLCSKADMTHRGTFRVKARAKNTADEEQVSLRLLYRVGNTPYTPNDSVVVSAFATASYVEVDLGTLSVPAGSANLDIVVQARSDTITAAAEGVRLDYLTLIPTERYGVGAGETVALGGSALAVADEFNHDDAVALTGTLPDFDTTAPPPDAWVGAGDADDFTLDAGFVYRYATVADADLNTGRYVAAGSALTNCEVGCGFYSDNVATNPGKELRSGLIARYADASNWVGVFIRNKKTNSGRLRRLVVYKRVTGTLTKLAEIEVSDTSLSQSGGVIFGALSISVTAAGVIVVKTGPSTVATAEDQALTVSDGSLPASGKLGLYSAHDFASSQSKVLFHSIVGYSGVGATTETYAIPSTGRIELGSTENTTYTAATAGDPAPFVTRGSRFSLPVGDSRITIKARRNDVDSGTDLGLTDSTKARYAYTPRFLLPPPPVVVPTYEETILADLPALYWRLGVSGITDQSGNGRNGTGAGGITIGGVTPGAIDGDADTATDFDGTDDWISSTYDPYVNSTIRSFEGWANRDTNTSYDTIFSSTDGGGSPILRITELSNDIMFGADDAGSSVTWAGAAPGTGTWFHWVLVFNESTNAAELFINGVSLGSQTHTDAWVLGNFALGAQRGGGLHRFDGKLDEVAVYEYGLTAAQILAHYTAGT